MTKIGRIQYLERLIIARSQIRQSVDNIARAHSVIGPIETKEAKANIESVQYYLLMLLDKANFQIEQLEKEIDTPK